MATTRNNSGADYTLKLGLDTSAVEKAQARVEAILKRTGRVERVFNNERISSAARLLKLERQIANQRTRGLQGRRAISSGTSGRTTSTSAGAFTPPSSRRASANTVQNELNKIDELLVKIEAKSDILDPAEVEATKAKLRGLSVEMRRTTDPVAIARLRRQYSAYNREISQTIRNQERLNREMSLQEFASKGLSSSLMNLARSYFSIFAVIEGARGFINITKKLETANVALINAAGSAEQAAKDFEFVRQMSNKLGLEMISTADAFGKFGAAAKLGGLTGEQTREIFQNIGKAVAGAALPAERASLVFQAFQQVMGKGVLSMEEVRQQIGESLPQGMAALSIATGKSGQELFKYIESGKALSKDVLPVWARELARLSEDSGALEASTKTLNAEWNRFKNTLTDLIKIFSDGGATSAIGGVLGVAGDLLNIFKDLLMFLKEFVTLFSELGLTAEEAAEHTDKIGRKLSIVQRITRALTGLWNGLVGSIRFALGYLTAFIQEWKKAGVLGIGEALGQTEIRRKRALEISTQRARARREADVQRDKQRIANEKARASTSITINNTNNVSSSDPTLAAEEIERRTSAIANKVLQQHLSFTD